MGAAGMLGITLQDLRYRARQFLIAVAGASLVFAMTLLLAGLTAGFSVEVDHTVAAAGATRWVVARGAAPRVSALAPLPVAAVAAVAASPGAGRADPVVILPQAALVGDVTRSVVVVGSVPGRLGAPRPTTGRPVTGAGQAVVDTSLGLAPGASFSVAGHRFRVVGTVTGDTLLGGIGDVYLTVADAQTVAFGGRPLVSAVLTSGVPRTLPAGLESRTPGQIERASLDQMSTAVASISNSRTFMWFIAAVIVAALIYVTALERVRDFAVLKALGSSSGVLFLGLAVQAVAVALAAALVAAVIANFMTGLFVQPVDIPAGAFLALPVSALVVGLVASLAALRRAVSVDPAMAFAGG